MAYVMPLIVRAQPARQEPMVLQAQTALPGRQVQPAQQEPTELQVQMVPQVR